MGEGGGVEGVSLVGCCCCRRLAQLINASGNGSHPARPAQAIASRDLPRLGNACRSAVGRPILQKDIPDNAGTAGGRSGDLESARLLGWVLKTVLREEGAALEGERPAAIENLVQTLSLDFPSPTYPEPPSTQKPF